MRERIALTEGSDQFSEILEEWKKEASEVTIDSLAGFLKSVTGDYVHDYGTICHAVAVSAVAAAKAVDKSDQGGITGFQAGAIMWEFIRQWNHSGNKTGMKLVDYDDFLYPQYENNYQKTLTPDVWANIQKEASCRIGKADDEYTEYLAKLHHHEIEIKDFVERNPDYYDNKSHYDPIGVGTGEQWLQEKIKRDSGFEFAPQEPYCPVNSESPVYRHWEDIVSGIVPFGFTVED
jgi:hypothetical protein